MDYDLRKRLERLEASQSWDEELGLLYEWVKTGVISKQDFIILIREIA